MSEQIDIAVDLGVVAPPLPGIMSLRQLVEAAPDAPAQIIEGVLHRGCKMVSGGNISIPSAVNGLTVTIGLVSSIRQVSTRRLCAYGLVKRLNKSRHRVSGDNINLKFQHRSIPVLGASSSLGTA